MKAPPEKPLGLDMGFGEALRRFIQTDITEIPDSARLARSAKARAVERSGKADAKADPGVARTSRKKMGAGSKPAPAKEE